MNSKSLALGLVAATWLATGAGAMAQSGEQSAGKATPAPGMGMQAPGARGPMGEHHGQGPTSGHMMEGNMMGRGMMGGGTMGGGMMGSGMMSGRMTGGHMMGACPMMGMLPPGNEKLSMRMHGEIMVAIGNILMKHADSIQAKPAN